MKLLIFRSQDIWKNDSEEKIRCYARDSNDFILSMVQLFAILDISEAA